MLLVQQSDWIDLVGGNRGIHFVTQTIGPRPAIVEGSGRCCRSVVEPMSAVGADVVGVKFVNERVG